MELTDGSLPFSLPIIRTLAITLPGACKLSRRSYTMQTSGVLLPAPGPALFVPPPPPITAPPHSPFNSPSPRASRAAAFSPTRSPAAGTTNVSPASSPSGTTSDITHTSPDSPEEAPPTGTAGIRPVLTPMSASNPSYRNVSPFLLIALLVPIFLYNN